MCIHSGFFLFKTYETCLQPAVWFDSKTGYKKLILVFFSVSVLKPVFWYTSRRNDRTKHFESNLAVVLP
ncbi:hypothetical protein HanIR_Chr01g0047581 [Helianthus annuus]|nr:hypothetical protein HanIR_Chr01g0047581 [Helianthus annuus]